MKGSPGTPTQRFSLLNRRESTVKTITKEPVVAGPSLLEAARLAAVRERGEDGSSASQIVIPTSPLEGTTRSMLMRRDSGVKTIVKSSPAENVQNFLQQFAPVAQAQAVETEKQSVGEAPIMNTETPIPNDLVEIKEIPAPVATSDLVETPAVDGSADRTFDQVWQLADASGKHGDDAFWEQLAIASEPIQPITANSQQSVAESAMDVELTNPKALSIDLPTSAEAAQEALEALLNPSSDTDGRDSMSSNRAFSPSPRGSSSDRSPPPRARRPSRVVSTPPSSSATSNVPLSPTARSAPVSPAPRSPTSSSLTISRSRAYSIPNRPVPTSTSTPIPRTTRAASLTSPLPRSPTATNSPAPKSPTSTPQRAQNDPELEDLSEEASDTISAVVTRTRALSPAPHRPPASPRSPFIADAIKPRFGFADKANQADEFDGMAPSYGQLQSENIALMEENARLKAEIARLQAAKIGTSSPSAVPRSPRSRPPPPPPE